MSTTSMSLESLQFLLQHMDANRRFEIYNRCPSLREFEKSVPLKIDFLVLTENHVIINDVTYKLGIIRKYNVGETPQYVTDSNETGGLTHEVDRYGIKNELDAFTVTPGDVEMKLSGERWIPDEDSLIRYLERRIQRDQGRLAREREMGLNNQSMVDYWRTMIEVGRAKLFDCECRRDNIPPNFEHFFQLTKSRAVDEQEQRTIQRYVHNKKYSEAMKQLTTELLGGRSSPISVTKFKFVCTAGVIRLPIKVKFLVEQLMFNGGVRATLEALAPISHESSYPLKKLAVRFLPLDEVNNPIVRTAGILRIRDTVTNIPQALSSITNPVVRISIATLPEEAIEELVENWIALNRPVGNEYIFDFFRGPRFASDVEDMLKKHNGAPVDDENIIIPMSNATQLKVSYGPFPVFAPRSKWAVRFSTEAITH
ncbi:unnamed protein product [Caenorhabditis brenneri]